MWKREKYDTTGLLLMYMCFSLSQLPILSTIILYFMKLDPFFIASFYVFPTSSHYICNHAVYSAITAFIFNIFLMHVCQNLQTMLLLLIAITQITITGIKGLHKLSNRSFGRSTDLYRTLCITHGLHDSIAPVIAVTMGIGYMIGVFTGAITIVGWNVLPIAVYVLFPLTWIISTITMLVALPYAAKSYELSQNLLREWKYRMHSYFNSSCIKT